MQTAQNDCRYCGTTNGFLADTTELDTLTSFVATTATMAKTMQGRNLKVKLVVRCDQ
jgi:hypothetical protein